jgi:hypothetical protein
MIINLSIWVFAQVLMRIYIFFIVNQQIPVLKVFREKLERPNNYEKPMHYYNACMAGWVTVVLALMQFSAGFLFKSVWSGVIGASIFGIMMIPFYMLFFNRGVNKGLGNDPNYLGSGADSDKGLTKLLGMNAGKKAHRYCIIAILVLNLLFIILTVFVWK